MQAAVVAGLCLAAFAARLVRLDEPSLRWDEGFSIAHATLDWGELLRVAALDWHPPLYTLLLKAWLLVTGKSVYGARLLSVLLGVLAVPLAVQIGRMWSGSWRIGLLAGAFAATWPLLVYYGQVARMYPLAVAALLLAVWGLLRGWAIPAAVGTAGAMYSLYYAIWPLAGLYAWALAEDPRRWRWLALVGGAAMILYAPWIPSAADAVLFRTSASAAQLGPLDYLWPTLDGLFFTYGTSRRAVVAVLALVAVVGIVVARVLWIDVRRLGLPAAVVVLSLAGLVLGASRSGWFAVRHLAPVAPFLGFVLAWALDRAWRWQPFAAVALVGGLAWAYWPTSTSFVYAKTLEVVDPFDPTADYRYIKQYARSGDVVFFNVLPIAGWYEQLRQPNDPPWSHAMRWDPIVEPMRAIEPRLTEATGRHERLWFVLYKGEFGWNEPLARWPESTPMLYPAGGEWREDTWYRLFVAPKVELGGRLINPVDFGRYRLLSARVADGRSIVGLELTWVAFAIPAQSRESISLPDRKVFVHAVDARGVLVAQHDGLPAAERRPPSTWQTAEHIVDRHGLSLPDDAVRPIDIRVGLYDPSSGTRERAHTGGEFVAVASLR